MVITVRDACEAYIEFYGFENNKPSRYGYELATRTHDLDHVMIGRVPDFVADGMSLDDAMQKAHDEHLEDFVWFKSENIVPIYNGIVFDDTLDSFCNIGISLLEYRGRMDELFNNTSQYEIKTPYPELKEIIDRDFARNDIAELTYEEKDFHYQRAMRIRESYQAQKNRFSADVMDHPLTAFADPERHLNHKPVPVSERIFSF